MEDPAAGGASSLANNSGARLTLSQVKELRVQAVAKRKKQYAKEMRARVGDGEENIHAALETGDVVSLNSGIKPNADVQ